MSLFDKMRNAIDPQVRKDVEFATSVDYSNHRNWRAIEQVLMRYYNIGGLSAAIQRHAQYRLPIRSGNLPEIIREERRDAIPDDIKALCSIWFIGNVNYTLKEADELASETARLIKTADVLLAGFREDEAKDEAQRLRAQNERLETEKKHKESIHREEIETQRKAHKNEIGSLKEEISELKNELSRVEARLDGQKRARRLEYLSMLESRLQSLEAR